jgi:cytochrome c oxidase subunit 1
MPRRIFTFLPDQGFETSNLVSTIGAFFMAVAVIVMLINVIMTSIKNERVGNDPWGDGRTLEWAISSPPPFYNFKQLPLVRGLDAYWIEKMDGKKDMTPAEPLGDIHMPNSSFVPVVIAFGLFVAAFGAVGIGDNESYGIPVLVIGFIITFGSMFFRSVKDDHGFHIHKEDLLKDDDKGGKA